MLSLARKYLLNKIKKDLKNGEYIEASKGVIKDMVWYKGVQKFISGSMNWIFIATDYTPIGLAKGTFGLMTSLSCQKYIKIVNNTSGPKDIEFKISETDLLPYMRKIEAAGYDGLGFHAHKFKLLYQKVSDSSVRPDSGSWKTLDFTSTAITGVAGQTIDPKLLETQTPLTLGFSLSLINDANATTFDITQSLSMAPNLSASNLQFGDERFFYGNINTYIGATIYKTIFDVSIDSSIFDSTTNPTRSKDMSTNPANIRVSEVGIYDTYKNLVCIGKISTPIALFPGTTITLELSMDF